ncbi:MAG: lipid II flippase MurJ [Bdellovibrionota bacterium]
MKRLLKNASKVSGLTMVSRVFGLVRDQLFAAMIGAGFFADCFVIAFRIPNLLRDLFAEGALSNAFVPTLTKTIYQDSPKQGLVMVSKLKWDDYFLSSNAIIVLGILFAPQIVHMIAPGFSTVAD